MSLQHVECLCIRFCPNYKSFQSFLFLFFNDVTFTLIAHFFPFSVLLGFSVIYYRGGVSYRAASEVSTPTITLSGWVRMIQESIFPLRPPTIYQTLSILHKDFAFQPSRDQHTNYSWCILVE